MNQIRAPRRVLVLLSALLLVACTDNQTRADENPAAITTAEEEGGGFESEETAEEASPKSPRESLLSLLGGYEQGPSEGALRSLGSEEEVVGLLIEVWGDESIHRHRRLQALMALRFFPEDSRTVAAFEEILEDPQADRSARRRAVHVYGELRGEEAVELLARLLTHEDEHTRVAAIEALQTIGTPEAVEALCAVGVDCEDDGGLR